MTEISVRASINYTVSIGSGLIDNVGEMLLKIDKKPRKLFIVTDENVAPHYLKRVVESFQKAGYKTFTAVLSAGEDTKSIKNFASLCSMASSVNLTRGDAFVALGGGVIGDLVGFVSSSFMRGVDFVQIPTTLLASIDSSVGGKTAVNIPEGKNLVGAFHQPIAVFFDTQTMKTLPSDQVLCGIGEAIKYAVLCGGRVFDILSDGINDDNFEELVKLCVECKAEIVEQDETEHGRRKLLNLGHTIAHAIEKLSDFTIPHGVAVVKGLYQILLAQVKEGSLSKETFEKIEKLINKYDYDLSVEWSGAKLASEVAFDKKSSANGVSLIKVREIGDCYDEFTDFDRLGEMLS